MEGEGKGINGGGDGLGLGGGSGGFGLGGAFPGGQGGRAGGEGGEGGGRGGGNGGDWLILSPKSERGRTLCLAASLENHDFMNHMLRDQNETGRVAHVHREGHGAQVVVVQ